MEGSSTNHAWRTLAAWWSALTERQAQARARRELGNLNDHFLKDIGLERGDIDRLFR